MEDSYIFIQALFKELERNVLGRLDRLQSLMDHVVEKGNSIEPEAVQPVRFTAQQQDKDICVSRYPLTLRSNEACGPVELREEYIHNPIPLARKAAASPSGLFMGPNSPQEMDTCGRSDFQIVSKHGAVGFLDTPWEFGTMVILIERPTGLLRWRVTVEAQVGITRQCLSREGDFRSGPAQHRQIQLKVLRGLLYPAVFFFLYGLGLTRLLKAGNISKVILPNSSLLREFHLKAFVISVNWNFCVVSGVLLIYLLSVLGNLIITALICLSPKLHTPMYFFLCSLSVQDIIYVSTFLPKLLAITITGDTSISFLGCITQIYLLAFCVGTEFFLLTSMAYDRYVAICIPLRYSLIISRKLCSLMISASWVGGFLNALVFCIIVSNLSFCNKREINNFFCDIIIFLKLSCSDITYILTLYIPIESLVFGLFPFSLIMASYICIISTILKIRTSSGRLKTFSSCSSHLTVVILFCGTFLGLNLKPKTEHSLETDKLLSMLYIGVVPMVNPLVYSLRNKEVLKSMKSILKMILK
ncbi:olfactory receptor 1496-like [Bombina bombina]|uniref:olfactory receptor 1496-like n=1 Tax=Bombina bombina TaxID=8345 RepID=UPI00235A99A8|nr:olfactory receptor 1496-like [Bombina bombina]